MNSKNITHLILLLLISFGSPSFLSGQIEAPNFLCVSNDTLRWELPANSCGPFTAYLVYASQDEDGPYSLLATVTDPAQDFFFHENPGAGTWYYYLESDFDCPGEEVLASDTLDNRIPLPAIIQSVSVTDDGVVITWEASGSPEVIGYIISRQQPGAGTLLLDTVFGNTTYLDTSADPFNQTETYFIEAIDPCGNKSLVSDPHSTLLLAAATSADLCDRAVVLEWNAYEGWGNTIEGYDIMLIQDNGDLQLAGTVPGTRTNFSFEGVEDGQEYCFAILANQSGTDNQSASSTACVTAMVTEGVLTLTALNATVVNGNAEVSWVWNTGAVIDNYTVQRATENSGFAGLFNESPPPPPLNFNNTYTDASGNTNNNAFLYQVQTDDACDETRVSNTVATLFLEATALNGVNLLNWTPYINEAGMLEDYRLFRLAGGGNPIELAAFGPNVLNADDMVDLGQPDQVQACYFVEANATVRINDSLSVDVVSRSNVACAQQEAKIYVPTAFSPNGDGRNDTFRPFLQFGAPATYQLIIYDRWGGQVFESLDIEDAWDGTKAGESLNTGSYAYTLRIEQADGTLVERSGEILLVR